MLEDFTSFKGYVFFLRQKSVDSTLAFWLDCRIYYTFACIPSPPSSKTTTKKRGDLKENTTPLMPR